MAMAMQSGIGISKVLFIAGAGTYFSLIHTIAYQLWQALSYFTLLLSGYTGTILIKNGKLSDIIGELQVYVCVYVCRNSTRVGDFVWACDNLCDVVIVRVSEYSFSVFI